MKNYEAYDTQKNVCIYNGSNKFSMITELLDYLDFANHIDFVIGEDDVRNLNEEVLRKAGIAIYINAI